MSLRPQPLPPVPETTARVARAAFRRGNPYLLLRDRLGPVFEDADFAELYPRRGQPGYAPWRLALMTLMQFREGLSDRQAADAVRGRIDWKYLLSLDLDDAGFDFSVLCEFRARLLGRDAAGRLLNRLLDAARAGGLLRVRGRSRTDSTHVLAAVRALNRPEFLGETLRAALNAIAAAPDWLHAIAPAEWHGRYDRRVEGARLPRTEPKREAYTLQVSADGFRLLDAVNGADAPESIRGLSAIGVLRRVWARHFEQVAPGSGDDAASAGASRARSRRACGPSARAGRATAGWPRRACRASSRPPPWTSIASPHGSPSAPSHQPEPRASLRSLRRPPTSPTVSGRLRKSRAAGRPRREGGPRPC